MRDDEVEEAAEDVHLDALGDEGGNDGVGGGGAAVVFVGREEEFA